MTHETIRNVTRRDALLALAAAGVAPSLMAQQPRPTIPTRRMNNVMIAVSDVDRSAAFYERLFGPPTRQGDTAVFRGWVRAISSNPAANIAAIIGDGPNYHVYQYGPNQHSGPMPCDGVWHQFTLTYVVPLNPSYTRLDLSIYDAPGTQCWFDDVSVEIR